MPAAWSVSTGRTATVIAVLDVGIDYTDPDLYLNIWLNPGEIPADVRANLTDTDNDGLFTFRDLNAPANAGYATDLNGNGYVDGGDLLRDPRWANGSDEDNNGKVDDLIGWDFRDHDNDPSPPISHGTEVSKIIGAVGNNAAGTAGVMWAVRLMPIRMEDSNSTRNIADAAAGLDYAVAMGAGISNNSWGDLTYSQVMYDALARARLAGHLFVASAGNDGIDLDVSPRYPAAYDLDNIVSVMALDANDQKTASGSWGLSSVDLAAPTPSGANSHATPHVTGAAGLLAALHPDWTYAQIKAQILTTVDPLPSLAGLCVTGGRLNAARAVATTSISIDNPTVAEGDSGTRQLLFTLTRFGDVTGSVTLNWSTADGTATAGSDYPAASGQVAFLPSGGNTRTITVGINGDLVAELTETLFLNLTLASGNATVVDDQAQGTITDNDTKFYVINDGSPDRTYEYGITGAAIENYTLSSADTAPRGAASTAAGAKVWVVDANKTVYVYNPNGGLLGSWSAAGLQGNAQLEGIATNGTDIWLLDNKTDKVFKYTGAATRLSGSQSAASSFSLNSANTNGKGIVTDGTSLWVVDDGATDKVFKYTLTGSLLGSWTIDVANAHPTGITINPANVSDIWIVDNGTLRVYQYTAAAGRTSGSLSAAATFALAAGNTNPQDIADPPPADTVIWQAPPMPAANSREDAGRAAIDVSPATLVAAAFSAGNAYALDIANPPTADGTSARSADDGTIAANRALPTAAVSGERHTGDRPFTLATSHTGRSASEFVIEAWTDEEDPTAAVRDAVFVMLADDAAALRGHAA